MGLIPVYKRVGGRMELIGEVSRDSARNDVRARDEDEEEGVGILGPRGYENGLDLWDDEWPPPSIDEALQDEQERRLIDEHEHEEKFGDSRDDDSWRGLSDDDVEPPDRHGYQFLAQDLECLSPELLRKMAIVRLRSFDCSREGRSFRSWKWRRKRKGKTPSRFNTQHRLRGRPSARLIAAKLAEAESERRVREESRLLTVVKNDGRLALVAL